ncbi:ArdC-like ssDNA-binding domain-containing protein [Halobacterium salinarum]|uniref:ArdC-like ssDNA-binding domain-containing protein n=1 Tax=Halobacterium salinarum TaxID=2242 RepID=UPI001EEC884B|nr:ArdC-like ssDNA-binding domain-containing protein [Halobacterium salinarum]MCF2165414.1 DUF955 domain-containing protein [Halobacterium salinarum]MCF2168322.1 DUF955 domain-containing protein [Halobacterium salinarum]
MTDTLAEWVNDLQDATESARDSETFRKWLDTMAQFHSYSSRNALLIKLQKPNATRVASMRAWNDLDRSVKSGSSAIWIRCPIITDKCPDCGNSPSYHSRVDCNNHTEGTDEWDEGVVGFKPAPVFDVSQTEGKPLPESPDIDAHADDKDHANDVLCQLMGATSSLGYEVTVVDPAEWTREAKAVADTGATPPAIEIQDRAPAAAAGDLAHEIAHAYLHTDSRRDEVTKAGREIEAEAVAYVVGRYFGLDVDGSRFYLSTWADDASEIQSRLEMICRAADAIIEACEAQS